MDRPKTRYARSGDLSIAYQVHGSGPHDIVFLIPADSVREFADLIPDAQFRRLPGTDLFIYVLDPDRSRMRSRSS